MEPGDFMVIFGSEVAVWAEWSETSSSFWPAEVGDVVGRPRPEVEDVGEVAVIAVDPCFAEHSVEEPTRWPHKWPPLPFFVLAPSFPHYGHPNSHGLCLH
jgi:hypothetical protein